MKDLEDKKRFLLNSGLLYNKIISLTEKSCLKRFLAFKIIINAMSFEDIVNDRQFSDFRGIRDIFLAHKQDKDFFNAYWASEEIKKNNIEKLIDFMIKHLASQTNYEYFVELIDLNHLSKFESISKEILKQFEKDFYNGTRINNNFLCSSEHQIKEISSSNLAGSFYRYNSSMELSILSNYFITNLLTYPYYPNALINFKIDYIFHSVNMKDCIFKDTDNKYSIDGLLEVLTAESIGNTSLLKQLLTDTDFQCKYGKMRYIRNKIAAHMDRRMTLSSLLKLVDDFDINSAYDFVNKLDKAVWETAKTNIKIRCHYYSFNATQGVKNALAIAGIKNTDYDDSEELRK
jgi:hypothetical protein